MNLQKGKKMSPMVVVSYALEQIGHKQDLMAQREKLCLEVTTSILHSINDKIEANGQKKDVHKD